jgi:hypothetical protein
MVWSGGARWGMVVQGEARVWQCPVWSGGVRSSVVREANPFGFASFPFSQVKP